MSAITIDQAVNELASWGEGLENGLNGRFPYFLVLAIESYRQDPTGRFSWSKAFPALKDLSLIGTQLSRVRAFLKAHDGQAPSCFNEVKKWELDKRFNKAQGGSKGQEASSREITIREDNVQAQSEPTSPGGDGVKPTGKGGCLAPQDPEMSKSQINASFNQAGSDYPAPQGPVDGPSDGGPVLNCNGVNYPINRPLGQAEHKALDMLVVAFIKEHGLDRPTVELPDPIELVPAPCGANAVIPPKSKEAKEAERTALALQAQAATN